MVKLAEVKKDELSIVIPFHTVFLHKAIMVDGRTEQTINKIKFPTMREMGLSADGHFVIKTSKSKHVLPFTSCNHAVVEDL